MLTKIKTEYGGITQMVENPAWDEGKTSYVLTLLKSLHGHIAELDTELSIHVKEKFSQEPR